MSQNPLKTILEPKSIAVLGASNNPQKMGTIQYLNILHSGFPGEVLPVHPKEKEVFGKKAYADIKDLPYAPDMALLVVPTRLVPEMVKDLCEIGTRHALIVTAGFKEVGEDGQALEKTLVDTANEYGMRFIGPNCMGAVNAHLPLNMAVSPLATPPGYFSLASQSGTYITQTNYYLGQRGIRISKGISVGNEASIDLVDCLDYLGQDPDTKAIGLYIECIRRPQEFLELAREITKTKPIVAQYIGGNEFGARSGSSHTGAMAGPDYIYDGLFEQAGVIRVDSIEEVYRAGDALAHQPLPRGRRIAVLTNSGGPGSGMATTLERMGMDMPPLSGSVQAKLREIMPPHAPVGNPVDLTFHTDMTTITEALPRILLEDEEIDGLLLHGIMDTAWAAMAHKVFSKYMNVPLEDLQAMMTADLTQIKKMPAKYGKPLYATSFFDRTDHCNVELQDAQIPVFDSPERAARVMGLAYRARQIMERQGGDVAQLPPKNAEAAGLLSSGALDEYQAKGVLRAYGIETSREILAGGVDQAVAAAGEIGYPVAVKGCSAQTQHKTELGLVHLNLKNDDEVVAACKAIDQAVPGIPLLVAEMLPAQREIIAGMTRFPTFPPLVLCGLGGVYAEAIKDTALRLAPLSGAEAEAMVKGLKCSSILDGFRGLPPVDLVALGDLLVKVGNIALLHPEIAEMDLNPILFVDGKPKVVDALIVLE